MSASQPVPAEPSSDAPPSVALHGRGRAAAVDGLRVLKLGGSVLTNKDGYCEARTDAVTAFGQALAALWPKVGGRLVVVVGGGSFGNQIPLRYGIADCRRPFERTNLFQMTSGMFAWASMVAELFGDCGVPAYPFQTSALVRMRGGQPVLAEPKTIGDALGRGLLPIMTGDLIFTDDLRAPFTILSSDELPALLAGWFDLSRVVIATDVAGLRRAAPFSGAPEAPEAIVGRVDLENAAESLRWAGPSRKRDLTGGMRTKTRALLEVARRGVPAVLCEGKPGLMAEALLGDSPPGTFFVPQVAEGADPC